MASSAGLKKVPVYEDDSHFSEDRSKKKSLEKLTFFKWFLAKGYMQGVFWALMIGVVSVSNDVLMRLLGNELHVIQIIFFRFFFSMLLVLPMMFKHGLSLFKTNTPFLHLGRPIIGAGAIGACCYAVNHMPLSENTTIMFAQPLFFLPMAALLLKEKVDFPRWLATIIGFFGLLVILQPGTETFKLVALVPVIAAVLFASLDLFAKKMVSKGENSLTMIFYFALGTTLVAGLPLLFFWKTPSFYECFLLVLLGLGANMIQVCIYKAFSATDASGLMPFRYVEFIFSALAGFLFFYEVPSIWILAGGPLIAAAALYISYKETQKEG